jgi:hypothetical protein
MATEKEKIAIAVYYLLERTSDYDQSFQDCSDVEINKYKKSWEHAKKQLIKVLPEYANIEKLIDKDKKG